MKKHRFLAAFTACTLLALTAFGSFTEAAAADSRTAALTTQAESYFNFHKDTQHWGEAKTYISAKEPIGRYFNLGKGRYEETKRFAIRYSSKGVHLHPVKEV